MPARTLAFLTGIVLLQQFSELPGLVWTLLLLLVAPGALRSKSLLITLSCWFGSGFLWALFYAHLISMNFLIPELEGRDLIIEGHIATLPLRQERRVGFEFEILSLMYQQRTYPTPGRVRLRWYGQTPKLSVGDIWRLQVRLKRPHGFLNPGGFDYEGWLFGQGIRATGYIRHSSHNRLLASNMNDYALQRLRQYLLNRLNEVLKGHPTRGLLTALAMGERSAIEPEQWRVLRRTGTNHLVAISGLHIGLVAVLIFFLMRRLWGLSGALMLYMPAPKAAAVASVAAALGYAALAGFSIPTQRAVIMITVIMSALILQRVVRPNHSLALALLLVLLWDPLAILSAGFWLSFAAVAVITYVVTGRHTPHPWWHHWGRIQWIISIGLFPLLLTLFQQVSLIAPLANLIAVPVVSLLVVPLTLTGTLLLGLVPSLGGGVLLAASSIMGGLWILLDWLGNLSFAVWTGPAPPIWALLLALLGLMALLAPRGWPARWLGGVLLLPILLIQIARPGQGEVWFTLLDVGQGLAAVVQTRNHAMVFDTGPRYSHRFNTGDAVVVPFLRQAGIHRLDMLVISHGDNDHIGGARSIVDQIPVTQILTSVPHKLQWTTATPCSSQDQWEWDGVRFHILHPLYDNATARYSGGNEGSCVLYIHTAQGRVLLTGDIEKGAEKVLLRSYPKQLVSDILVAPHHGSNTSSTADFINAVAPRYVLFPVGYRNRYRFPAQTVVDRYRLAGVQLLDTANSGAIGFKLSSSGQLVPHTYRQAAQHYWHTLTPSSALVDQGKTD